MYAIVREVTVLDLPFVREEGERWDLFSGPDLYYEVYDYQNEILETSAVVSDVCPPDLPVTLEGTFAVQRPSAKHCITLFDADLTDDDVIGSVAFDLEASARSRSTVVHLERETLMLRLTLSWERPDKKE